MTITNAQFAFEDRYPFLDLTRSTEREFSPDLTQKCYEVFRSDYNTMQDHYRQARISQNLTQNLTQKLEEDIHKLKVQAARLKDLLKEYDDFKTRTTKQDLVSKLQAEFLNLKEKTARLDELQGVRNESHNPNQTTRT